MRSSPDRLNTIPQRIDRLPMTRELWLVLLLAGIAWLVESYDIGIMGSVLPSLQKEYNPDPWMVGLIATASTLGIVLAVAPSGHLADRFGRKKPLLIGTAWYALASVVCAYASGPTDIVALRFIGGIGMGMVFPIPYAMAAELMPGRLRGSTTSLLDAFLSVGYLVTPLVAFLVIPQTLAGAGWRWLFLIGGIPALYVPVMLRWLPESPRWLATRGRTDEADRIVSAMETAAERRGARLPEIQSGVRPSIGAGSSSVGTLFRGGYRRRTLMMWTAFSCLLFVFYAVQTYMPTVLIKDGHGVQDAFLMTALIVGVSILGKGLSAVTVERFGRKPTIVVFGIITAGCALLYGLFHLFPIAIPLAMVLSFFGIGVDPVVKIYGAEQYPTQLRETGVGMVESVGRFFGGVLAPFIMSLVLAAGGVSGSYFFVGVVALVGALAVLVFGRETMGRPIEVASDLRPAAEVGWRRAMSTPR